MSSTLNEVFLDDEGFTRGKTPFMACVFRKHEGFYFAEKHLPRFLDTCAWARLPTTKVPSTLEICEMVKRAIDEKEYEESLVKIYATCGRRSEYREEKPVVIVDVKPRPESPVAVALETIEWTRLFPDRKLTGAYAEPMVYLDGAKERGYQDLLYINRANLITESTTANVFFVTPEGELMTSGSNVLLGVTREKVLDIARESGLFRNIDAEASINAKMLARFSEVFVTSTTRGVTPVYKIFAGGPFEFSVGPETHTAKLHALFCEFQEKYFNDRGV